MVFALPPGAEIARHYGQAQTASAIEHRFRDVRERAELVRRLVNQGLDPEVINVHDLRKAGMDDAVLACSDPPRVAVLLL